MKKREVFFILIACISLFILGLIAANMPTEGSTAVDHTDYAEDQFGRGLYWWTVLYYEVVGDQPGDTVLVAVDTTDAIGEYTVSLPTGWYLVYAFSNTNDSTDLTPYPRKTYMKSEPFIAMAGDSTFFDFVKADSGFIGTVQGNIATADSAVVALTAWGPADDDFVVPDTMKAATLRATGNLAVGDSATFGGHTQQNSTLTVGVDGTGYDVNFYGVKNGSRLSWNESKSALFFGVAEGDEWHEDNTGLYTLNVGYNNVVSDSCSAVIGEICDVYAPFSLAGGWRSVVAATGERSIAWGCESVASGYASIALGFSDARGRYSTALGRSTVTAGFSSGVGYSNSVTGSTATAVGSGLLSEGYASTSLGFRSSALGDYSLTCGRYLVADSANTMVIGSGESHIKRLHNHVPNSIILGANSETATMTIKKDTTWIDSVLVISGTIIGGAVDVGDTVEGTKDTSASSPIAYHLYTGGQDTLDEQYLHVKGPMFLDEVIMGGMVWHVPGLPPMALGGSGFTVGDDADISFDTTGIKIGVADSIRFGTGPSITATANLLKFDKPLLAATDDTSGGDVNFYGATENSRMFWDASKMAFMAGYEGGGNLWVDDSVGIYSVAMGNVPSAKGIGDVALGYSPSAHGPTIGGAVAIGFVPKAYGDYSVAIGPNPIATGTGAIAMGGNPWATGDYSIALGYQDSAKGDYSITIGKSLRARANYSMALGRGLGGYLTNDTTNSLIIGFGTTPALFVGGANNRVGVNTMGPTEALEVSGNVKADTVKAAVQGNVIGDLTGNATTASTCTTWTGAAAKVDTSAAVHTASWSTDFQYKTGSYTWGSATHPMTQWADTVVVRKVAFWIKQGAGGQWDYVIRNTAGDTIVALLDNTVDGEVDTLFATYDNATFLPGDGPCIRYTEDSGSAAIYLFVDMEVEKINP